MHGIKYSKSYWLCLQHVSNPTNSLRLNYNPSSLHHHISLLDYNDLLFITFSPHDHKFSLIQPRLFFWDPRVAGRLLRRLPSPRPPAIHTLVLSSSAEWAGPGACFKPTEYDKGDRGHVFTWVCYTESLASIMLECLSPLGYKEANSHVGEPHSARNCRKPLEAKGSKTTNETPKHLKLSDPQPQRTEFLQLPRKQGSGSFPGWGTRMRTQPRLAPGRSKASPALLTHRNGEIKHVC